MAPSTDRSQSPTVRLLVLEAELPHPEVHERRGRLSHMFEDIFKRAGEDQKPHIKVELASRYIVEFEDPLPSMDEMRKKFDAVLITGSEFDAYGDDGWILKLIEWIQEMWKVNPQIRLSGVCFGHQVNCRALGAIVEQSPTSWELSHTEIKLSDVGKKLFEQDSLALHQMHQDHVRNPPSNETDKAGCMEEDTEVHVWGSSDDCKVQGIYIPKRLFTSQGHLGYDEHMVKKEIETREEKGLLGDHAGEDITSTEEAQKAKDRAYLDHDGEVVAGAILRFFAGWDD